MFKRIKYVSRVRADIDADTIEKIGERSRRNNEKLGITGVLMTSGGVFYQLIEGPPEAVDQVYAKIVTDDRHGDVLMLSSEEGVDQRMYPDWSMETVNLDAASRVRLLPLKALIRAVYDQRRVIDNMLWAIDRTIQSEIDGV